MTSKTVAIGKFYKIPFKEGVFKMYLNDKLCAKEISDKILIESGISITYRSIQRYLKSWGATRPLSEAFNLAIKRGRKSYKHLTKPIKSSELRVMWQNRKRSHSDDRSHHFRSQWRHK